MSFVLAGLGKTETLRRLIVNRRVTLTCLILDPCAKSLDVEKLNSDYKWLTLKTNTINALNTLCDLSKSLTPSQSERLVIRLYDRAPTFSMVAIDPETDEGVLQIGNYMHGTDANARLVVIVSKKARSELFERWWQEYLLLRNSNSVPYSCSKAFSP